MGKESQPSPGSTESPIKDKQKEKYAKTHINQTNKSKVQRKNIKGKGKLTNNIQLSKTEPGRNIKYEFD